VALHYPENYEAPAHWHTVGHIEIVLSGTLYIGGRAEPPGTVRVVPPEFKYGPIVAPQECRVIEIFPVNSLQAAAGQEGEPGRGWLEPDVLEAGNLLGLT
jgi:hypothetical protein